MKAYGCYTGRTEILGRKIFRFRNIFYKALKNKSLFLYLFSANVTACTLYIKEKRRRKSPAPPLGMT